MNRALQHGIARVRDGVQWRLRHVRRQWLARVPHHSILYATVRSALSRRALPPGDRRSLAPEDGTDRTVILRRAQQYGPIFSATSIDQFCVCITDLELGRQLLTTHADALRPLTIDIAALVPGGFMRQMEGDTHRHYRKALARAVISSDLNAISGSLRVMVNTTLREYASTASIHENAPTALHAALTTTATAMLVRLFFGVDEHDGAFASLMRAFRALGPAKMAWAVGATEQAAFTDLRAQVRALVATRGMDVRNAGPPCIASRLAAVDALDDTMLGNLIYMVEMGRFDMSVFFGWLMRYASAHSALLPLLAAERAASTDDTPNATAFVLETLRRNQSDRLMRRAKHDIVFGQWLIPKFALVRIGMWEAHHNGLSFPEPLLFSPSRFQSSDPRSDTFSPFGVDKHVCPFAQVSMQLATIFLTTLAAGFEPTLFNDGPPVIGMFHWEPHPRSSVSLTARPPVLHE